MGLNEKVIDSASPEETYLFAEKMGSGAKKGQVYCLTGDLGMGKTLFAKGFAAGLGIKENVNSPTFTLVQEYEEGRLPLYHFDVYRIGSEEEMFEIGCDDYFYGEGVCLVEWADLINGIIPDGAVWINIDKDIKKGCDYRKITIYTET